MSKTEGERLYEALKPYAIRQQGGHIVFSEATMPYWLGRAAKKAREKDGTEGMIVVIVSVMIAAIVGFTAVGFGVNGNFVAAGVLLTFMISFVAGARLGAKAEDEAEADHADSDGASHDQLH